MDEIWKPINGYDGLYEISNYGRVKTHRASYKFKNKKDCFLKNNTFHPSGYFFVTLIKDKIRKSFSIHKLVACHFIENPNNLPQINHIDCDKSNNKADNLEWCDNLYNHLHAKANGLFKYHKGSNHGMAKLNESQVEKMREMYKSGLYTHKQLGVLFGIERGAVTGIINRKTWKHI